MHMGNVSGSVQNVTQVHQHFYAALPPQAPMTPDPPAAPAEPAVPAASVVPLSPAPPPPPATRPVATAAHKEVLALMKPLSEPVRIKVLDFMRREFGTAMVIDLQPQEVYRVRRYVETVNPPSCRKQPTRHNPTRP